MKVGIDLGTSYSLVARIGPDGTPVLMPDYSEHDLFHTPSQVYISGDRAFIGRAVGTLLEQRPELDTQVIRFSTPLWAQLSRSPQDHELRSSCECPVVYRRWPSLY